VAKEKKTLPSTVVKNTSEEPSINKYYLAVSERYRVAKYITVLFFAFFVAVTMIVFRDQITYSNLMYLLRDFNTGEAEYSGGFDPIEYDEQENMTFAIYRDELVVAGNRSLRLYNTKGTESRKYDLGLSDPVLASSDKYLLAFSLGDPSYSVFTSVTKTHSGTAPGPVEDCAVNDSGEYILLCRSDETKYVVCFYDSSFREYTKYYKNKYVTSVDIGDSGQVLILSVSAGNEDIVLEAELYLKGQNTAASTYSVTGAFPVDCGFGDNGSFYIICTDRVLFFNNKGELIGEHRSMTGYTSFYSDGKKLIISAADDTIGTKSSVFLFDMAGELLYNGTVSDSISSVTVTENEIFALTDDELFVIPYMGGDVESIPVDDGTLLLSTGGSAVLCGRNGAGSVRMSFVEDSSDLTDY